MKGMIWLVESHLKFVMRRLMNYSWVRMFTSDLTHGWWWERNVSESTVGYRRWVACSTKWGSSFFKTIQCGGDKGIILSRIYPARDVVHPVWYNISALIRYNFIITNYVNRQITSYIYLLISTISLWLHVKHFIALTKRESVRRIYFVITGQDYILVNTSTSDHEKHGKVR
jgi:hypothetical protein